MSQHESAKVLTLPGNLKVIEEEAFMGDTTLQAISVPAECELTEIRSGAFKNCSSLVEAALPDSVLFIAGDAFDGCPNLTLIVCSLYCQEYAESRGIPYRLAG